METSGEWMTSEIVLTMGRRVTDNVFSSTDMTGSCDGETQLEHTDHGDRWSGGRGEHKEKTQEVRGNG